MASTPKSSGKPGVFGKAPPAAAKPAPAAAKPAPEAAPRAAAAAPPAPRAPPAPEPTHGIRQIRVRGKLADGREFVSAGAFLLPADPNAKASK